MCVYNLRVCLVIYIYTTTHSVLSVVQIMTQSCLWLKHIPIFECEGKNNLPKKETVILW